MGLQLAKELRVCNLKVYSDYQLVVNQVYDTNQPRGEKMVAYLEKTKIDGINLDDLNRNYATVQEFEC